MTSRNFQTTNQLPSSFVLISLLTTWINVAFAALPAIDFDRMGTVGLAGSFAGFDFSDNSTFSFDQTTSTFLSRTADGIISPIASTNSGGRIVAGCTLANTFYFAGSFTSINGTNTSNIASYTPSTGSFAVLAGGLDGEVDALYCDQSAGNLWAGGAFTAPTSASGSQGFKGGVAIYNVKANSWSPPPFGGLSGAAARVRSITPNPANSSLYFAGSFLTAFQSNTPQINGTNNPNVPFSIGATSFSSSLVPIPLTSPGTEITPSPSNPRPEFSNISNILCPAGPDGPDDTWLAQDDSTAVITVRTFQFSTASGLRLGNTFVEGRGTTAFSVLTIPDNQPLTFHYVDPVTLRTQTCSESCPLGTDPSVLYQDFLFNGVPQSLTGIQITLTQWKGAGSGLHILQLLSSGAFASAVQSQNLPSCFSPAASTSQLSGNWSPNSVSTSIAGTTQPVLVATVNVGTASSSSPSVTWLPYVSASGDYDINLLVPGCTNMQDCPLRTSVKVTVSPGGGLPPLTTVVRQDVTTDATAGIYRGPIYPTGTDFTTSITMQLADNPAGAGQNGQFQLVADRVQLVLTSVNSTGSAGSSINGSTSTSGSQKGFGFFEWNLSQQTTLDATGVISNSTETPNDALSLQLYSALGNSTAVDATVFVNAVATHSSGAIFVAGNFTLASGPANIAMFKGNSLVGLPNNGLNGPVNALAIIGDSLYVGGVFSDTASPSGNGAFRGVVRYDVASNTWDALLAGVNGAVTSISIANNRVGITGNFTSLPTTPNAAGGTTADGFATWDINAKAWINSGGFLQGSMTLVVNGTGAASEFLAGSVSASRHFGGDGFAVLSNVGSASEPVVSPLSAPLASSVGSTPAQRRRSLQTPPSWFAGRELSGLFSRQASGQPSVLPASPIALAPSVLTGAFWTNTSSSAQTIVLGGNFSFTSGSTTLQNLAFYDPKQTNVTGVRGAQVNGSVKALEVSGNTLYVGGQFTLSGAQSNGFAVYDLNQQQWDTSLQGFQGSAVVVRSITSPPFKTNTVVAAGTFTSAGTLPCQSICQFDTSSKQWAQLGSGIQGDVSTVLYTSNPDLLIAAGSILLSDGTPANVAAYSFTNNTWSAVGQGSQIPGPVTACEVDNGNFSSIFAAGSSTDGSTPFLTFWNGLTWKTLDSTFQPTTSISQLAMVPLQDLRSPNPGVIEPDRILLVSGTLVSNAFGNASSALFDGQTLTPYLVTTSSTGGPGFVSQIFHSLSSFSFSQRHFLPVGVIILISIAIATGIVFLLLLIGILWTLFSRRDHEGIAGKYDQAEYDDDSLHRPSSLLAHINAATRGAIIGNALENPYDDQKGVDPHSPTSESHENTPYIRSTDTPVDAAPGTLMSGEGGEMAREVHVRYSFEGEGEGELPVSAGTQVMVLDDRDPAWWYAKDTNTGREGVIPASYLY